MMLDTLSKQCIILGIFTMAVCADLIFIEGCNLHLALEDFFENPRPHIVAACVKIAAYVALILIAILKIVGIKRRSIILVIPWLLAALGGICYVVYEGFIDGGSYRTRSDFYIGVAVVVGVSSILFYPLLTVLKDMRAEKLNALNESTGCKNYVGRI